MRLPNFLDGRLDFQILSWKQAIRTEVEVRDRAFYLKQFINLLWWLISRARAAIAF